MRRRIAARAALGVTALAAPVLLAADPAAATFSENTIGCRGHATITSPDGKTYEIDANDKTAKVPTKGTVAWEGAVDTVTHNHSGAIKIKLPFRSIEIDSWGPSANSGDEPSKKGTKELPSALDQLPAGKFAVTGFHQGDEGRCAGSMTLEVDGSPFGTPAGVVALAGTVVTAGLLGLAMKASA